MTETIEDGWANWVYYWTWEATRRHGRPLASLLEIDLCMRQGIMNPDWVTQAAWRSTQRTPIELGFEWTDVEAQWAEFNFNRSRNNGKLDQ